MKRRGFTLIELLVTLAILALLGTLVVPVFEVTQQRRHEQELRRSLREIRTAIDAYKKASDEGRIAKAIGATGYPSTRRSFSCAASHATRLTTVPTWTTPKPGASAATPAKLPNHVKATMSMTSTPRPPKPA
jgi:prepilin-type N-terminal cleavage/methylation domain-containing protein